MPLLGVVNTAVLGHLDEIYYLGALAVGGIIFNFIYWGFGFLRMGTTGLTAQAYGTKDDEQVFLILVRTLLIALAGALLLILSQKLIATVSFSLIKATPEVKQYAEEYFYIRIYAAPATLALYALHGWFLGRAKCQIPAHSNRLCQCPECHFQFDFCLQTWHESGWSCPGNRDCPIQRTHSWGDTLS